jgi:hypothetical protein
MVFMHDPISALLAKDRSNSLARSALPCAPVLPDERLRRRGGVRPLRIVRLRTRR